MYDVKWIKLLKVYWITKRYSTPRRQWRCQVAGVDESSKLSRRGKRSFAANNFACYTRIEETRMFNAVWVLNLCIYLLVTSLREFIWFKTCLSRFVVAYTTRWALLEENAWKQDQLHWPKTKAATKDDASQYNGHNCVCHMPHAACRLPLSACHWPSYLLDWRWEAPQLAALDSDPLTGWNYASHWLGWVALVPPYD